MIKLSAVHPALLAAYRLLVAAVVLTPMFMRDFLRHRSIYTKKHLWRIVLPGVLLGFHFITWNTGARMTLAANASLIINMMPVVMPFLLFVLVREKPTRYEWLGTALALVGVALLAGKDLHFSQESFFGDLVCAGSMLCLTSYLALARKNRDFPSIWLYLVPLYFVAFVVSFVVSLFFVSPLEVNSTREAGLIVALGLGPTIIGHSIFNYSMKHMRGQIVTLTNLCQFIFAGIMAYLVLNEVPSWMFYIAAGLVALGVFVTLRSYKNNDKIGLR